MPSCTACGASCIFLKTGQCRRDKKIVPHNRKQKRLFNTGDVACSFSNNFLGHSIKFISKRMSPDKHADFNHAFLLTSPNETFESLLTVQRNNIFAQYEGKNILVGRYREFTHDKFISAFSHISKLEGDIYPYHRLILHMLNLAHVFHWKKLVCSELVYKYLFYLGASDHKWFGKTPDMLADDIMFSLNNARTGPRYDIVFNDMLPYNFYRFCPSCDTHFLFPQDDLIECHFCGNKTQDAKTDKYRRENLKKSELVKKRNVEIFPSLGV